MALRAVGARKQVTAGYYVRVLARYWRQRRADAELLEGLDRIPGADASHFQLVPAAIGERCERIHVRILGHAISQHDETQSARHAADVQLEVLFFVEDRRPVQSPLRLPRRVSLVEIGVLRHRAARAGVKDPDDVVAEAIGMARGTGAPAGGRHPARDRRATRRRRIEHANRGVVQLLPDVDPVFERARRWQGCRLDRGDDAFARPGQIENGDVPRHVVHHVGAGIVAVHDDAARIAAGGDLQHSRRIGRIAQHPRHLQHRHGW